jgi:hypothetical protein
MTVAEAHIALAQMIGDPILVTGSPTPVIPDGVRYSKALRDIYLWRGMVKVISDRYQPLAGNRHEAIADALGTIFPTTIVEQTESYTATPSQSIPQSGVIQLTRPAVFVLGVGTATRITDTGRAREIMYSYKVPHEFRNIFRRKSALSPDPSYTVMDLSSVNDRNATVRFHMSDADFGALTPGDYPSIVIEFLPIPTRPSTQASTALLDCELVYVEEALAWADLMARYDAQDLTANPMLNMGGRR